MIEISGGNKTKKLQKRHYLYVLSLSMKPKISTVVVWCVPSTVSLAGDVVSVSCYKVSRVLLIVSLHHNSPHLPSHPAVKSLWDL